MPKVERNGHGHAAEIDRLPPHDLKAEQAVLGCVMLTNQCLPVCMAEIGRTPVFYDLRNQVCYDAMQRLYQEHQPIDLVTMRRILMDQGDLENIGGVAAINSWDDGALPQHVRYYLGIVKEKYFLRSLIATCTEIVSGSFERQHEIKEFVTRAHRQVSDLIAPLSQRNAHERWSPADLMAYDVAQDPNAIIGMHAGKMTRYLCRGYGMWLIGQSHLGKSSLGLQMGCMWSVGLPFCGIAPVRPVRFLVIQAENDKGDAAEALQGIMDASGFTKDQMDTVLNCVRITRCRGLTGQDFCRFLEQEIIDWRADVVLVDPLLRFAGIDVSRQDQCTRFLNEQLDPVLATTGAVMIGAHHTGKPKAKRDTQGWTLYDKAYSGIGSSDLVNWARAIMLLETREDGDFELTLAKRGKRAFATHPCNPEDMTNTLYLKHHATKIYWVQIDPPPIPERKPRGEPTKGGRPNKIQEIASRNLHEFCAGCKETGETKGAIAKRLETVLAKDRMDVSEKTCVRAIEALVGNGKLLKREDGMYVKGPQA